MFEHTHWVNRYREKLSPKGIPYYKQLGLFEQDEKAQTVGDQQVKANPAPTPINSPAPITPNEAAKNTPPNPNPNVIPKNAPQGQAAKMETQKNNPRVQEIFAVFIQRLREIDDTVDAYIKSAIKNFEQIDPENYLRVREEEKSERYEKVFLKTLKTLKEKEKEKLEIEGKLTEKEINEKIEQSLDEFKNKAREAAAAAESNTRDSEEGSRSDQEGEPLKKGLGIFGKNAQAVRMAKHVMLRIICFELLGVILGESSPMQVQFFNSVNKSIKPEEPSDKEEQTTKDEEDKQLDLPFPEEAFEEYLQTFIENEFNEIVVKINDELTIVMEAEPMMGTLRTLGNIFAKGGMGLQDSMVKLSSGDPKKLIGLMIKWFFTKQSFSTRIFGGTNAMAIVDSLTNGYLRDGMRDSKYKLIKDYLFTNIPQNFKVMDEEEFSKTIKGNAKKFQVVQGVINSAMKDILQAFIKAERLNV